MDTNEKVEQKFQKLLTEGKEIFNKCGWNGNEWYSHPSEIEYLRFRTEALNLINRVCGENSIHYKELKSIADNQHMTSNAFYFHMCYGILEAAHNDFTEGFLFDLRSLITAELLGSLLDQSEALLDADFYIASASLAGAVLEDSLRTLCRRNAIPVPDKTKIDKLNIELGKNNVYDPFTQKMITALADIRNNADHGHKEKIKKDDVTDMVQWIRKFESNYLK
jgi:hypothetical protein